jgi:uncharacterized protein YjdB
MREAALPSPGPGSRSMHLRRVAANRISSLEVTMDKFTNGIHPDAAKLKAFFDAASVAAGEAAKRKTVATLTAASGTVAVAGTLATTLTKGGSAGAATYATSNAAVATVSGSGVVTGVAAGSVEITATVAGTSTYRVGKARLKLTVA